MDPAFQAALEGSLHFWYSVAEALDIPRQRVLAPRFALKLEGIKEVIATGQFSVARNLTWEECEKLMGFPAGWTVVEGDSSGTPLYPRLLSGSEPKSKQSKPSVNPKKPTASSRKAKGPKLESLK